MEGRESMSLSVGLSGFCDLGSVEVGVEGRVSGLMSGLFDGGFPLLCLESDFVWWL